jgi:hypothetical protein
VSARLEMLASERRQLQDRSALYRLRLRRDAFAVRGALPWKRVPTALATAPVLRTVAWSLAMSLLGAGRVARVLLVAGRVILAAKLARAAIGYARAPRGAP